MTQQLSRVRVHRLNDGAPIIGPTENWWENGVTFNAGVVHLRAADPAERAVIARLLGAAGLATAAPQDLVAVLYRGRPRSDPGHLMNRSRVGLALFDARLEPVHRFDEPFLWPDPGAAADDYLGCEDPRVTRVGDRFVMVYCGAGQSGDTWRATLCTAESDDLLEWRKRGATDLRYNADVLGKVSGAHVNNKDGVLVPANGDGWHYLLHRPMVGPIAQWSIHLARGRSPDGAWDDLGPVMRAPAEDGWADTWLGAGAVPLPLGGGRFLEIYHTGHRAADGTRLYTLGAATLDLRRVDPSRPQAIVESRLDHFMVPETPWEIDGPYPDSVGNVLFTCGAYERDGAIHILYGGGDTYVMAARVDKDELLAAMGPA